MSEVSVRIRFDEHPCTNHTAAEFTIRDEECECQSCRCDDDGYCCGNELHSAYCPDCGDEVERPFCYPCGGEDCGNCGGETISEGEDVTYTGLVTARWSNGRLVEYRGGGHPHLMGTFCLGNAAELFDDVRTTGQAIEAISTHIGNVDFNDGLGGHYHGIGAA